MGEARLHGVMLQVCWILSTVSLGTQIPVSYLVMVDLVFEVKQLTNLAKFIDETCSQRSITPPLTVSDGFYMGLLSDKVTLHSPNRSYEQD